MLFTLFGSCCVRVGRIRAGRQREVRQYHYASKIQGLYKIAADRVRVFYVKQALIQYQLEKHIRCAMLTQRIVRGHLARNFASRQKHNAYVRADSACCLQTPNGRSRHLR